METEQLYYQDVTTRAFTAEVLSCRAYQSGFAVILDRTAFYPEGGGQPADHGKLGGITVTDVREKDGQILHFCTKPLETGSIVEGLVDWERRFDHMQQHSGEHIISGLFCTLYDCENVGFHLGTDTVTIDYNRVLTTSEIAEAERLANEAIYADLPIDCSFPSGTELSQMAYRSKKELTGQVRIVRIPDIDCCACCGTQVASTGQVGLIKVLSAQKFRDGVRLEILCGRRALRYLSGILDQNRQTAQNLSAKPTETSRAVERMKEELSEAKNRIARLEEAVFSGIAEGCRDMGDVLLIQEPMRPDALRRLADAAAKTCGGLCAVFSGVGEAYSYALIQADGADIAPLVKELNAALHGRGGGKNGYAQGSVAAGKTEIQSLFEKRFGFSV